MNNEISSICKDPEKHTALLMQDDDKTWHIVQKAFNPFLLKDIEVSIRKILRDANVEYDIAENDIPTAVYEISKESWATFRAKLTKEDPEFKYESVEKTYNYLRVVSWNKIRNKFRGKRRKEVQSSRHLSLDELDELDKLDNYLYTQGGYIEGDLEANLILKERIANLVQVVETLSESHQLIVIYRYVYDWSALEIAGELNMTVKSVYTTLSRIRATLAKRFIKSK